MEGIPVSRYTLTACRSWRLSFRPADSKKLLDIMNLLSIINFLLCMFFFFMEPNSELLLDIYSILTYKFLLGNSKNNHNINIFLQRLGVHGVRPHFLNLSAISLPKILSFSLILYRFYIIILTFHIFYIIKLSSIL